MKNIINAKLVRQNNQEFLIGIFKISEILNFTKYTERLIVGFNESEIDDEILGENIVIDPVYNNQIQRKTNNAKIEKIADFLITDPLAMFPTNIVIAIPQQVIDSKTENQGEVLIELNNIVIEEIKKADGNVFLTIIDGQHRIKGVERAIERLKTSIENNTEETEKVKFQKILERLLNLELIVTFFIDPILEYQAMIFSTINKTQTKVPENLVYSLFGLTSADTPQKTSLEVILALNGIEKSPFNSRIKLVGGDYKRGDIIPLSQATMVKSILFNICKNIREAEIERTKERNDLSKNPNNLIFRTFYANNNDRMIVRIMFAYFTAIKETVLNDEGLSFWDLNTPTNILHTNVGYQSLIKILVDIIHYNPSATLDNKEYYKNILHNINSINWLDNGLEPRYPFTSKSVKILYSDIKELLKFD